MTACTERAPTRCRSFPAGMLAGLTWAPVLAAAVLAAMPAAGAAQERATGEEYEVRGTVADSAGGGLANAMVVALSREDSVLVKYSLTNRDGHFAIDDLPAGEYILQVTLIGYGAVRRDFDVTDADFDAGEVTMSVLAVPVDSLVISVEHVPFINRRDTLSYNVAAFETPPNASVEDLLRRLPGIEVAEDGSIKAQGEDVRNVLVDGKEFFGKDPTIATRNLPAAAVRQVDVYDKQSDMAEFTGIPDGQEERTLDLRLREEARVGYFGQAAGGFGTDANDNVRLGGSAGSDRRYAGSFNVNRFSPTGQYAVVATANNTNQLGFSTGVANIMVESPGVMMVMGGLGGLGGLLGGGGGGGFSSSASVAANASHEFGNRNWLRSSYSYGQQDNLNNSTSRQQALFGSDIASLVDESASRDSDRRSHSLNLNGQIAFSPGHQLRVRLNANLSSSASASLTRQETRSADLGMLNSAVTDNRVDGEDLGGNLQLTWRKRLNENGRSVVAELQSGLSDYDHLTELSSEVTGIRRGPGGGPETLETLQEQGRLGRNWNSRARFSLTQPMGEGRSLEVFGQRNSTLEDRDNPVHDLIGGARVFNATRSTGFERTYTYYLGGARFNRGNERHWFMTGLRVQRSNLDGIIQGRDERIANGYTHLLADVNVKLEIKDGHNFNARYGTSSREPSLNQLQTFVNNTDPLNIYMGNPDLQPEYTHRVNAEYRFFDEFSFVNFFTNAGLTYTDNTIAQSRFFDERGIQTRSPINTEGSWSGNVGATFGTPLRRLGLNMNLDYRVTYSEGTELVNLVANDNTNVRNTVSLRLDNRVKDRFEVRGQATFNFNSARYSLNEELNRDYLTSNYSASGILHAPRGWRVSTNISYQVYDRDLYGGIGGQSGFSQPENIARWNASVMRRMLENRVEIQLQAFDLLNQNKGVNIAASSNFIRESRTEALGRFFMLRVSYRLGAGFMRGVF